MVEEKDIIAALREADPYEWPALTEILCSDAADEIERLRLELEACVNQTKVYEKGMGQERGGEPKEPKDFLDYYREKWG